MSPQISSASSPDETSQPVCPGVCPGCSWAEIPGQRFSPGDRAHAISIRSKCPARCCLVALAEFVVGRLRLTLDPEAQVVGVHDDLRIGKIGLPFVINQAVRMVRMNVRQQDDIDCVRRDTEGAEIVGQLAECWPHRGPRAGVDQHPSAVELQQKCIDGPATGNPDIRSASAGVTPRKLLSVALSTPSLTVVTWMAPIVRL